MSVSRISPDGAKTVEQVTVDGKNYDLPPWVEEDDFVASLKSGLVSEPFASLISCELVDWKTIGVFEEGVYYPFFKLQFFVPFGEVRELVANRFGPDVDSLKRTDYSMNIKFSDAGAIISLVGMESFDFNDIQVYLLPKNLNTLPQLSDEEDSEFSESVLSNFEWLQKDFESEVKELVKWGSAYQEVDGPEHDPYFLLVNIHQD
jgi:hypothetical protein